MKLATFRRDGVERIGIVHTDDTRVFDLAAAALSAGVEQAAFASMLDLIDADDNGLDLARDLFDRRSDEADLSHDLKEIELLPPLPRPRQMRDGMSYKTHILQATRGAKALLASRTGGAAAAKAIMAEPLGDLAPIYREIPMFYITNRLVVRGPGATIKWPRYSQVMDYELEYAVITKRTKANIPVNEAKNHIFGYTILNDFSARDIQGVEMQGGLGPSKGKSFDGSNVIGPWIVTPDELGNPQELKVAVRVNGETRAESTTGDMLFTFDEVISYASQDETVHAGELFGSGTVGNCCGLEFHHFLKDGDLIELDIEKIGVLANRVQVQA